MANRTNVSQVKEVWGDDICWWQSQWDQYLRFLFLEHTDFGPKRQGSFCHGCHANGPKWPCIELIIDFFSFHVCSCAWYYKENHVWFGSWKKCYSGESRERWPHGSIYGRQEYQAIHLRAKCLISALFGDSIGKPILFWEPSSCWFQKCNMPEQKIILPLRKSTKTTFFSENISII